MQDDSLNDLEKSERASPPIGMSTSSRIWRYFLFCGTVAVLSGYILLVGTLAEEISRQIIWALSFSLMVLAGLTLTIGMVAIAVNGFVQKRISGRIPQAGVSVATDLVIIVCLLPLLIGFLGFCITVMQLSLGQFLIREEEIQYRHLIVLSAYAGAIFGITAGCKSKISYGMGWAISIWHGARVLLETAFFAYAGLWLSREPFEYALTQSKKGNWEIIAITMLGVALIFTGTLSLMFRQSQIRPEVTEKVDRVPFCTRIRQGIQDLRRVISATKSGIERIIGTYRKRTQRIRTKVQPGGKVEIVSPELEAGQAVEVVVRPIKCRTKGEG